jgi:hypothetical protein
MEIHNENTDGGNNLRRLEEKLAMAGPLSSSGLWLENSIDHEKKQVLTVERELHRVGEEIQNRLISSNASGAIDH